MGCSIKIDRLGQVDLGESSRSKSRHPPRESACDLRSNDCADVWIKAQRVALFLLNWEAGADAVERAYGVDRAGCPATHAKLRCPQRPTRSPLSPQRQPVKPNAQRPLAGHVVRQQPRVDCPNAATPEPGHAALNDGAQLGGAQAGRHPADPSRVARALKSGSSAQPERRTSFSPDARPLDVLRDPRQKHFAGPGPPRVSWRATRVRAKRPRPPDGS